MKQIKIPPLLKWLLAISVGIVIYFYDDVLWGPVPIALATSIFGRVPGLTSLAILYFVASFIGCSLILRHYKNKKRSAKLPGSKKRRKLAYHLLLTTKWLGLAVGCFMLGAIVTAIPVGKFKLFPKINIYLLAVIMSFLFVVEFLGFYAGLFASLWYWGIEKALVVIGVTILVGYGLGWLLKRFSGYSA